MDELVLVAEEDDRVVVEVDGWVEVALALVGTVVWLLVLVAALLLVDRSGLELVVEPVEDEERAL